jgi:subtilisin family serine protease
MATPHVTGGAALYAARYPAASAKQVRDAILGTTRPTASLAGKTVTGGRLDVGALVQRTPVAPLALSISSVSAFESLGVFRFVVSLNYASASKVTVKFATANGTAVSGRNGDYTATSGTLTFNPGETAKVVSVSVVNDSLVEADETFIVRLSSASGALISFGTGTGQIVNDDGVSTQTKFAAFAMYAMSIDASLGPSPRKSR